MKILDIRFKNLNSLRGEWHIDLQDRAYTNDGIFLIAGPTGAGKTTIFDAVCLALYSQTHRLGRISGQSNEIMSKHTKECYAQVVFENAGKKYICSWEQHRAGRSNALQTPQHTLSEFSGEIISSSTKETIRTVEDITGMDFKRFSQAMMLEQGDFDAFLEAGAGERSRILELITGTEIYGRISTAVYDRTSSEEQKLNAISIEINAKKPNDDLGTDEEIQSELSRLHTDHENLTAKHKAMNEAIDWLKGIKRLNERYELSNRDAIELRKRMDMFSRDNMRLEAALSANEINASYTSLKGKRDSFSRIKARCESNREEIKRSQAKLSKIETGGISDLEFELKRIRRDTTESPDAIRTQIESLIKIFEDRKREALKIKEEKERIQSLLETAQTKMNSIEKEYDAVLARHDEAVLMKARSNLKPGEPCPVCGSTEHPAIIHGNPESENESIRLDFESVSKKLRNAQAEFTAYRTQYDKCVNDLESKNELADEAKKNVFESLAPLGIFNMKDTKEAKERVIQWAYSVHMLEENIRLLKETMQALKPKIEMLQKTLNDDTSELEILRSELEVSENDFRVKLSEKNFADEKQFMASRLSDNEVKRLQEKKQKLDEAKSGLIALRDSITEQLNTEKAKAITEHTLEELIPVFEDDERTIASMQKRTGVLEAAITSRAKLKAELEELNEKYQLQSKIYSDWSALNELIGMKNGNKYRIFAQRVTLIMMIHLANIQLRNMSGRYELTIKPDDDNLELSVIDKDQAGTIRPTSNLSGGERFIISLALALGLSQISGSKAQVDSLFLDEGFGSLDEESLNTALEALGEVRREGRMIGIISHVQALKERISAQINVIPKHEGTSIIEGPGCSGK